MTKQFLLLLLLLLSSSYYYLKQNPQNTVSQTSVGDLFGVGPCFRKGGGRGQNSLTDLSDTYVCQHPKNASGGPNRANCDRARSHAAQFGSILVKIWTELVEICAWKLPLHACANICRVFSEHVSLVPRPAGNKLGSIFSRCPPCGASAFFSMFEQTSENGGGGNPGDTTRVPTSSNLSGI